MNKDIEAEGKGGQDMLAAFRKAGQELHLAAPASRIGWILYLLEHATSDLNKKDANDLLVEIIANIEYRLGCGTW